ncbi:hypothetical protein [Oceanobacillus damuensis]|uniref:hypothetical protein n=1 Tax=Oceanobacillus damuensis TaxID=937928 RepID=UPI00082D8055|nr:hypothetical protein [Oceanobacillus damuensis]
MKKQLYFTTNQNGFFLPYAIMITAIVLLLITTSTQHYQRDIEITERHIQQLTMETLFQSGREKVKAEIPRLELPAMLQYDFPDGQVRVEVTKLEKDIYELIFTITVNGYDEIFGITNRLHYEEIVTE